MTAIGFRSRGYSLLCSSGVQQTGMFCNLKGVLSSGWMAFVATQPSFRPHFLMQAISQHQEPQVPRLERFYLAFVVQTLTPCKTVLLRMIYFEHSGAANAGFGIDLLVVKFGPQLLAYMLEDSDDSWSHCIMGERGETVTTLKGHLIMRNPQWHSFAVRPCFVTCSINPGKSGERGSNVLDPWLLMNRVPDFAWSKANILFPNP